MRSKVCTLGYHSRCLVEGCECNCHHKKSRKNPQGFCNSADCRRCNEKLRKVAQSKRRPKGKLDPPRLGMWSSDRAEYHPTKREMDRELRKGARPLAELVHHDRIRGIRYVFVCYKGERGEGGLPFAAGSTIELAKFMVNEHHGVKMSAWKRETSTTWTHWLNKADYISIEKVQIL